MSDRRPTRDDVARLAETSTAVVGYVINGGPRNVSPERRERVLAAMAALDYRPNAIARSLAATESRTIGMIVPDVSNAYFAELALAVEAAALPRDRLLFLGNSAGQQERETAYVRTFLERRVDGIVAIGAVGESTLAGAHAAGTRVVIVDRAGDRPHRPRHRTGTIRPVIAVARHRRRQPRN
ncbi:LacI family DNA-binding transcriptional regulator [Pseudonocardia sp. GCM10023141]|uniref:LacI family DNA-binding transcriptional regulator n=1 Tax=Pseudonocardia sp. GCM10023141 TaxID=3252653 RepID=UPI00360D94BF